MRSARGRRRGRLHILTARVADESGELQATWFNQPWLEARLVAGTRVRLRGQRNRYGFNVSTYDLEGDEAQTADFAPVYPASEELAQKTLRSLAETALGHARDAHDDLPATLRAAETLPLRADALHALHRPRSLGEAEAGRRRLAFDELLLLQLALARRAAEREAAIAGRTAAARRADRPLPRGAPVHAHRRARSRRSPTWTPISRGPCRCSDSCRATSARGRPSSRSTRCCGRSRPGGRAR